MTTPTKHSERSTGDNASTPSARAQAPGRVRTGASRTYYFGSRLKLLPGVTIPLRSVLVAATDRQILVSPVATSEEGAEIGAPPLTLVAPSLLHHIHLEATLARYRPVALWGPPGLAEKCPELGPIHAFGVDPWPHDDLLAFVVIEGAPDRNEVVFFHKPSRTIYTADLFFNIREPEGFLTPLAFRAMGIYRRFAAAKMWRRWVTDRAAFARSIDKILAWDFDRIVVAHGDALDRNARGQFQASLRELGLFT
jgi:hypothetical protein